MVIIDIETTGTDPRYHSIVSVGAVEFENPANEFYAECQIWEGAEIMEEALPIIGFTREDITDKTKQTLFILMQSFINWLDNIPNRTPAGLHVSGFDLAFLADSADRVDLAWPLGKRSVDLHSLVYAHLIKRGLEVPIKNQRSNIYGNFIQKYCGISDVVYPHNALSDAKWEAECFSRLLYGKKLLPEFVEFPLPAYLQVSA